MNIEIRGSGFSAKSSDFLPPKRTMNSALCFEKIKNLNTVVSGWEIHGSVLYVSGCTVIKEKGVK
jgi:hypothetical protein